MRGCVSSSFSKFAKKNILFCMIGPDAQLAVLLDVERAGVERLACGLGADDALVARPVAERAVNRLAPLRVTVFTAAPTKLPWRTSYGATVDLDLLDGLQRDRRDAGAVAGGAAEAERVVEIRAVHGDVVQPVVLAANVATPPYCGVSLGRSLMRPDTVGNVASSSRETLVAAPVRAELKIGLLSAVTTMVSATFAGPQRKRQVLRDAKAEDDVVLLFGLEPLQYRADGVGTTDAHPGNVKMSVRLRDGGICRVRRNVHGRDRHPWQHAALGVLDHSGHSSGGDALRACRCRPRQDAEQQ